ncbi:MAG: hypothetical protein KGO05_09820 [Chloroflexota bacterium]|nr:hypothetical protein [Chloroflexota bacterium]
MPPATSAPLARIRPPALYLIWVGYLAITCLTVGVFAAAAPARYEGLRATCAGNDCQATAAYLVALDAFTALVWLTLSLLVFWRRPGDRMGLFTALTLLTFGVARFPDTTLALAIARPEWLLPVETLRFLGSACLSIFVFVFPDGRFIPWPTRLIAAAWIIVQIPEFFFPATLASSNGWPSWLRFAGFFGFVAVVVAAQAWRYAQASTLRQRLQTRWAVLGFALALICYLALAFGYPLLRDLHISPVTLPPVALTTLTSLTFLLAPSSLAIAMLRNRLYAVDTLINRALVYGSLTVILATLYFGLVAGMQLLTVVVTRNAEPSALVIVVSTLVIAAAFQLLRRRLQRSIDSRFYRRSYNARATINAFAESLRGEVDLSDVRERLLEVTLETVQPTHVSLWLNPRAERERQV